MEYGSRPLANPNNPNRLRVLFVDDERSLQEFMRTELPRLGHDVTVCPNGTTALQAIAQQNFDFAILDIRMPDMTGIDVLQRLKQISPDTDAVMMTGYASEESMVQAMRLGACDYLRKPCKMSEIEAVLLRAADKKRLKSKAAALEARVQAAEGPSLMVGSSPAMQPVLRLIEQLGPTDARVLITGETGTGKEVVARSLFLASKRVDLPFVPVNCGTLNQNLAESELFGHKKGSHSTADRDRKGLFEVAHTGTLFLDELGDLDKNIQVKLLRFLESGEVRPLGATEAVYSDVIDEGSTWPRVERVAPDASLFAAARARSAPSLVEICGFSGSVVSPRAMTRLSSKLPRPGPPPPPRLMTTRAFV